ncbi:thioredoxin-related transmembrane protein 2 homolog [Hyalella azteca]|uniref:Thioredoxin-related transmembrane protein 2 homolog n=1 Tax=Hyalella azteca TaxID=294128 RepID=A0A8B7NCL2_HYAAZ|nr:thioredoxin-related transmembrane protein 2 homolog [Hyalella azteca]
MSVKETLKVLLHPYHGFNILFSLSYICAKLIEPLCILLFPEGTSPNLNTWESEVLFFLLVVVMFRTRRSGARTTIAYITTATFYAKACNLILWFSADPAKGIIYVASLFVHFLLVGEPVYSGPEAITYFQGCAALDEALEKSKSESSVWLIAFYAAWSPPCTTLAPIFSKLSLDYELPNLKFGKVDVGRYPEVARKYHINDTPLSLQLPTIAIYRDGELLMRRPTLDSNKKFQKFFFTEDNIRAAYDLNNVYLDCKKRLKEKKQSRVKTD